MKKVDDIKISEIIALRNNDTCTVQEIACKVGVSKSTVFNILKSHGLPNLERRRNKITYRVKRDDSTGSKFFDREKIGKLSTGAVGAISEEVAVSRMLSMGFHVWKPVVDDSAVDLLVSSGNNSPYARIQVKTARLMGKSGRPIANTHKHSSHRGYTSLTDKDSLLFFTTLIWMTFMSFQSLASTDAVRLHARESILKSGAFLMISSLRHLMDRIPFCENDNLGSSPSGETYFAGVVGIGRHTRLKIWRFRAYGFESHHRHTLTNFR